MNDASGGDKFQALPIPFGAVSEPRQGTAGLSSNAEVRPQATFHHFRLQYPRLIGRRKWAPRYPSLGLFWFVPFLGCCAPEATGSCRRRCGKARRNRRAMTMQFEWDGCTFYWYIPEETKRATGSLMTPGRPFVPLLSFVTPTLEWRLKTSTSTRRRKQQLVFPPPLGPRSRCGRRDRYIQTGQEAVRGAVSSWLWMSQRLSLWVPQVAERDHANPRNQM
ncbi:hypothetical protein MRX96_013188 [Rhipicephalus microplus]